MFKKLPRGDYQVQVKKYSFGFDIYDFTVRVYAEQNIKLLDVEQQEIEKAKKKLEKKKNAGGTSRTITESSNPTS